MLSNWRLLAALLIGAIGSSVILLVHAVNCRGRTEAEAGIFAAKAAEITGRIAGLAQYTDDEVKKVRAEGSAPRASGSVARTEILAALPKTWVDATEGDRRVWPISLHRDDLPAKDWKQILHELRLVVGHVNHSPISVSITAGERLAGEPLLAARILLEEPAQ